MITNAKQILKFAKKNKYAVPHFNVLDANFIKSIMFKANDNGSPVFISISHKSIEFIGGYRTFVKIVKSLDEEMNIKIPVVIHLDHGSYKQCLKAIETNFTSVMFDGSKISIDENVSKTKYIVKKASLKNISVEAEVGSIGGEEDDTISKGEKSKLSNCLLMQKTGITSLAIGINTIHGKYPVDWKGIDFKLLKEIEKNVKIPLVMHGGSGISQLDIQKSIKLGISKFNIGTALQIKFGQGIETYIKNLDKNINKKWYDPRLIINQGMKKVNEDIINVFDFLKSKDRF